MNHRHVVEKALRVWLRTHHSVIGSSEAKACGATRGMMDAKLDRGEWARIYPGVYRDTASPVTEFQRLRAVRVATNGHAVASHTSAAWLWGIITKTPARIEMSVPAPLQHGRHLPGVTIHRPSDLDPSRVFNRNGIPTTDPIRALVDLGASVTPDVLSDALDRALSTRLVTLTGITAELGRLSRQGRPGPGLLRALLLKRGFVGAPHPSVLESKTLRLIDRAGLPRPIPERTAGNHGQYRLDFAYPFIWFAIEVDGYVWHFSPEHMRRDNARRNALRREGWMLLTYTWRDIVDEPAHVMAEIRATYTALITKGSQPR